jgi:hypothetical protein
MLEILLHVYSLLLVQLKENIGSQLLSFMTTFRIFFNINKTGCVIMPYEVYPQAALIIMLHVYNN